MVVGPKLKIEQNTDGQWSLVEGKGSTVEEGAIWEVYADDFEDSEIFSRRIIGILNRAMEMNAWLGWLKGMFAALKYGLGWSP